MLFFLLGYVLINLNVSVFISYYVNNWLKYVSLNHYSVQEVFCDFSIRLLIITKSFLDKITYSVYINIVFRKRISCFLFLGWTLISRSKYSEVSYIASSVGMPSISLALILSKQTKTSLNWLMLYPYILLPSCA